MLIDFLDMFQTIASDLPPLNQFLLIILSAVVFGFLVSITYMLTEKNGTPSQSFALTLVILPAIVTIIIMMVGNNFAKALSLGGAFAIIRFRSEPGDTKDISFVLFCMAIGLTAGMGFMLYALCVTLTFCIVMSLLYFLRFAVPKRTRKILKITIPENFNYHNAFDHILEKYATNIVHTRVRTTDLGSLYELAFALTMSDRTDEKAMIDELRTLNGNLPIILVLEPRVDEYSGFRNM